MIFWRCGECDQIETTSHWVPDLSHEHYNAYNRSNLRYKLFSAPSIEEAKKYYKVCNGYRIRLVRKPTPGWRKINGGKK